MNPRQLGVMAAIAAILVVLVLMTGKGDDKKRMQEIAPTTEEVEFFKGVDPSRVMGIRLEKPGARPAVLKRTEGTSWTVETKRGPRPVRKNRADTLLGTTEAAEVKAGTKAIRQAEKAGSQASFGTDANTGTLVTLTDAAGNQLEKFILGNRNRLANATCFVRRPDSEATYLLDVDVTDNFRYEKPSDFLDPMVFPKTTTADIDDIRVELRGTTTHTLALRRAADDPTGRKWEYELDGEKGTAEGLAAQKYASTISALLITQHADDLPDNVGEFEPVAVVTFRRKGVPEPITMEIAPQIEGVPAIMVRLSTHPDPFGTTGVRHLLADPGLIKPFDPDAMSSSGSPSE